MNQKTPKEIEIMESLCNSMTKHTGRPYTFDGDTRCNLYEPFEPSTGKPDSRIYSGDGKQDSGFDEWQPEFVNKAAIKEGWSEEYALLTRGTDPKGEAGSAKTPLWLVPPEASKQVALVLAHGAKKYGAFNWRATRVCASTYISALMRHWDSWRDGEDNDPESGLSHLAHVAANVNILLDAAACGVLEDDRHKKPLN